MSAATTLTYKRTYRKRSFDFGNIRLVDIMIMLIAIELIAGGIIIGRELIEARKIRAQITQISSFNASVGTFYEKFDGVPGDLLAAQAERMGLPTGDGTPSHSDGDGKISPCSPGWQTAIGCESGLFWAQLASSELIEGIYTANVRFADSRVENTELMDFYLPQSTVSPDVYLTVWNSEHGPSPVRGTYIPDGNYFELTGLRGIEDSKIIEDSYAITPLTAKQIDKKIDDGYPLTSKILVNGSSDTAGEGWSTLARKDDLECVAHDEQYNTHNYFKAHRKLCHLAIALETAEN